MVCLKFAIGAYLAVVLQTAMVPVMLPEALKPNLLVVMAVYLLLTWSDDLVLVAAVVLGVVGDLTSLSPLGAQTLAFALLTLLIRAARPVLFIDLPLAHAVTAALAYLTLIVVYKTLTVVAAAEPLTTGFAAVMGQAAATGALGAIVCAVAGRWVRRWRRYRRQCK